MLRLGLSIWQGARRLLGGVFVPPPQGDATTYPDAILFEDGEAIATEDNDILTLEG